MPKRSSRLDLNQLAKRIVDEATGEVAPTEKTLTNKKADSRKGGIKGGKSRMEAMTPEQKAELGRKAAAARWGKTAPTVKAGAGATRSVKQR